MIGSDGAEHKGIVHERAEEVNGVDADVAGRRRPHYRCVIGVTKPSHYPILAAAAVVVPDRGCC